MRRVHAQVIPIRLNNAEEMFALASADLFSEYRNFLTGVEYSISVLRSSRSSAPVRLDLTVPPSAIQDGLEERILKSLRRYCDHRIVYNERERRAVRLDGLSSLWIGIPIVVLGFILVISLAKLLGRTGNANLVADTGGWVLVWVGLWFPLDSILFSPLTYGRENHALRRLRDAEVTVSPSLPPTPA